MYDGMGCNDQGQVIVRHWVYCGSIYDVRCCVVIVTVNTNSLVKLIVLSCWGVARV